MLSAPRIPVACKLWPICGVHLHSHGRKAAFVMTKSVSYRKPQACLPVPSSSYFFLAGGTSGPYVRTLPCSTASPEAAKWEAGMRSFCNLVRPLDIGSTLVLR